MIKRLKHINKKLERQITSKNKMCTGLKSVYISNKKCDSIYYIMDQEKIGHQGLSGSEIFRTCCKNNCDFVAKFLPLPWLLLPDESNIPPINEAKIQSIVGELGLAPKVHEVWKCEKGVIIIMDAMYITAYDDLTTVIKGESTSNRKKRKTKIFETLLKLIDKLHSHGIAHGDSHLKNFMRTKKDPDRYYFIDFGLSTTMPNEYRLCRDFKDIFNDIKKLSMI